MVLRSLCLSIIINHYFFLLMVHNIMMISLFIFGISSILFCCLLACHSVASGMEIWNDSTYTSFKRIMLFGVHWMTIISWLWCQNLKHSLTSNWARHIMNGDIKDAFIDGMWRAFVKTAVYSPLYRATVINTNCIKNFH